MRQRLLPLILVASLVGLPAAMATPVAKGTLVIAGGGDLPRSVFRAFIRAAGGPGVTVAVLPLASGDPQGAAANASQALTTAGAKVKVISYARRADAAQPEYLASLQACGGIWFTGGDQNRIGDLFVGTPLHEALVRRYQEGAVVGGTSAGAAAMTRIMLTGDGDPSACVPGTFKTREGLGLLPGCIVDQHFLRRQRQNRLLSLIQEHPDHLGLGIDEQTALLVHDGKAQVIGERQVMVFDPQHAQLRQGGLVGLQVHLLYPGQMLDLSSRQVDEGEPASLPKAS